MFQQARYTIYWRQSGLHDIVTCQHLVSDRGGGLKTTVNSQLTPKMVIKQQTLMIKTSTEANCWQTQGCR